MNGCGAQPHSRCKSKLPGIYFFARKLSVGRYITSSPLTLCLIGVLPPSQLSAPPRRVASGADERHETVARPTWLERDQNRRDVPHHHARPLES